MLTLKLVIVLPCQILGRSWRKRNGLKEASRSQGCGKLQQSWSNMTKEIVLVIKTKKQAQKWTSPSV